MIGIFGKKDSKVDNSGAKKLTTSNGKVKKDANVKVGGSFEDNGLKFTVNGAELDYKFNDEYGIYKLEEGKVYLKVDFTFENTGESDKYVSTSDFDCYADNTECKKKFISKVTGDFINTNLSKGRNVSFSVLYVIPTEAKMIELEYTANLWSDDHIIVKIK